MKTFKRTSSLALLISLLLLASVPTDSGAEETLGMGIAWAPIAGNGFSFRSMPAKGWGYQCGTVFWKNNKDSYVNIGGAALFILKRSAQTALYVPIGLGFTYEHNSYQQPDYPNNPYSSMHDVNEKSSGFAAGAGLGFTASVGNWQDVWFSFELVMMAEKSNILPMPQVAVHYFFR